MQEIGTRRPLRRNQRPVEPVHRLKQTLSEYYADKQERYGADRLEFFDRDLKRLFSDAPEHRANEKASRYVRRVRGEIIDIVGRWTSEYDYRINEVLKERTERCRELDLRVARNDQAMKDEMIACLTTLVMNKLHSGGFHIRL
jgi:excinuclease UvrABC helicase subunit UvrB